MKKLKFSIFVILAVLIIFVFLKNQETYASPGWVSPTGHYDPPDAPNYGFGWFYETSAYDDEDDDPLNGPYCQYVMFDPSWTTFLEFTHSAIDCDGLRFYAQSEEVGVHEIDVDVYKNGVWVDVYQGAYLKLAWVEKTFTQGSVTKMRYRFYNSSPDPAAAFLVEVDFRHPNEAPAVTTQTASSVEETTATGNGNVTNTGGENPTRYIQWGTTTSYGSSCNAGVGGTGAYSCGMTGLSPGTLYHARAYATNSGGTGYGGDQTFTTSTPSPPPVVDIKADGSDGPITIDYNTSATLSWTSTDADSCTASGDWSGSKPVSGSESTGNLTSSKTYTLTCSGPGGSDSDSVTVNIGEQPTLFVTLEAIPNSGITPLNDVDLKATVTGTATGTINYKFDCTNDGIWELEVDGSSVNPYTATDLCDYPSEGTHTAKVYVERDVANPTQDTAAITVSVLACSDHNVWGWAWSENIGWISFSCKNTDAPVDYGVDIDEITSGLSGYAWSEHIGWISFNSADLVGCPVSPCSATVDLDTGQVSGWAKALTYGDGWNGWLRLRDTDYGVWIDSSVAPSEFRDWSWSDMNIGWLSFNCINQGACGTSDYKVLTSLTFVSINAPEARNLSVTQDNYCDAPYPPVFLSWEFYDPNPGDTQGAYQIQVDNNSNFSSPENDSGKVSSSSETYAPINLSYSVTYYWRVKVWDTQDAESEWVIGPSFTTQTCHPAPDFTWSPPQPTIAGEVQFTDQSQAFGGAVIQSWVWTFENGDPASSTLQNPLVTFIATGADNKNEVTLTITDSNGNSCSVSKDVGLTLPLPEWREIRPF